MFCNHRVSQHHCADNDYTKRNRGGTRKQRLIITNIGHRPPKLRSTTRPQRILVTVPVLSANESNNIKVDTPSTTTKSSNSYVNKMKVLTINFQSIRAKKETFWELINQERPDVVLGCETWLLPSIADSEIIPPDYETYREDRVDGYGGVLVLVKKTFTSSKITMNFTSETIAALIERKGKPPLVVCSVYRPPNRNAEYCNQLCADIRKLVTAYKSSTIWIAGDTNVPDIDWTSDTVKGNRYPKDINQTFIDTKTDLGLSQAVNFATRDRSTLDIFLTNRPSLIYKCIGIPGISDHDTIPCIESTIEARYQKPVKRQIFLWKQADWSAMDTEMRTFSELFHNSYTDTTDINTLWGSFRDKCIGLMKTHVPSKLTSQRFHQAWINRNIKRLSRRKKRLYIKAKKTGKTEDWENFRKIKKAIQKESRNTYNNYVSDMLTEDQKSNPKKFWRFIKNKRADSSGVAALQKDGVLHSDSRQKAEILNNQFTSVFSKEDKQNIPDLDGAPHECITDIKISEKGVFKLLRNINPHKATGPDKIPGRLLKELASAISPVLTYIFNTSLKQGRIPDQWKEALVTPLFKKGSKNDAANYRPISITCICSKLMEHIMHSNIMSHLELHNILSNSQHGFRKNRSCETQLLITLQELADTLNRGDQADCILLDFSKAFDKVPHKRLLNKCKFYGIRGAILEWIESFLDNRKQKVVLEGTTSDTTNVTSGVPQGTVIGPLLFLIYINDLPDAVQSTSRLFADDCLLYRIIKNKHDSTMLQKDLDSLQRWANTWLMEFNTKKCEVLRVTRKRNPIKTNYELNGNTLAIVKSAKYLGLNISNDLSWDTHIKSITNKANNVTAFLRRNISTCPTTIKAKCYTTIVRPVVEYAAIVWDPILQKQKNAVEMVQRRAARFAVGDYRTTSSVTKAMEELKWPTLEQRRKVSKTTTMFKLINGIIEVPAENLTPLDNDRKTRGHHHRLRVPFSRTTSHQQSFFPSTTRLWNALPPQIINFARDENDFSERLLRHHESSI